MLDDDKGQHYIEGDGQLTFVPGPTPNEWEHRPNPLRQYDPQETKKIKEDLEQRYPHPRIIWDKPNYDPENDDVLRKRVRRPDGSEIALVSLTTGEWITADSCLKQLRFAAMAKHADVLLRRQTKGHVLILTKPTLQLPLIPLLKMLEDEERKLHRRYGEGKPFNTNTWQIRKFDGLIMNGHFGPRHAERSYERTPTRIPLDWIRAMLRYTMDMRAFERTRESECLRGRCPSTMWNRCPLYRFNLPQCEPLKAKHFSRPSYEDAA